MTDSDVAVDYDGEPAVPPPLSSVIRKYLWRSFSVADLIKRAIRGWLLGLVGLGAGFVVGIYAVSKAPPNYSVTLGLLPMESSGSDFNADAGALGALAGLVGINSGPVPKFTRFVSSLYATGVAELMDRRYDWICKTYSGGCDLKTHTWRKSKGFDAWRDSALARLAHLPDPDSPRKAYDLAQYTKANIFVSSDKTTHIVSLSAETHDPKFMSQYLVNLVQATNDYIKEQDRGVIQQYVSYLYGKLATNTNITQRDSLSTLLLEQERHLMLTAVNVPYAATIQDGPNVSEINNPLRTLVVDSLLGGILGAALGILLSYIPMGSARRSSRWRQD